MGVLSVCGDNRFFHYFEQLCSIPHGSGNTKKVSDWLVSFAVSHNLKCVQDSMNNVMIFKPASSGHENVQPVILQGHMDMVCVHTDDYDIDMKTTPVKVCTDGQWIWADRTSLGGDNGVAVCLMLAILERNDLCHPAIEAVFTSDEEPGMYGAKALDCSILKGRRIINLDCGPEGTCAVTCAGGIQVKSILPVEFEEKEAVTVHVSVDGLAGGHSGNMIGLGRGNANILLFRLISFLSSQLPVCLCSACGGKGENVIPSSSCAVLAFDPDKNSDIGRIVSAADDFKNKLKSEFGDREPNLTISVESSGRSRVKCISSEKTSEIASYMCSLPDGLQAWDESFENLPRTSLNMGILRTNADSIGYHYYIRSSVDEEKQALVDILKSKITGAGGRMTSEGEYSGWKYNPVSPLRELYYRTYQDMYGVHPSELKTHCGLECGTFYAKIPDADIIAISADQKDVHSVNEKLSAVSSIRMYDLLVEMLRRMKS